MTKNNKKLHEGHTQLHGPTSGREELFGGGLAPPHSSEQHPGPAPPAMRREHTVFCFLVHGLLSWGLK